MAKKHCDHRNVVVNADECKGKKGSCTGSVWALRTLLISKGMLFCAS